MTRKIEELTKKIEALDKKYEHHVLALAERRVELSNAFRELVSSFHDHQIRDSERLDQISEQLAKLATRIYGADEAGKDSYYYAPIDPHAEYPTVAADSVDEVR